MIAGWIVWEAIERMFSHHEIHIEGGLMLIVGGIGLGVNIVAAFVLHAGSKHSLNVDGAFKHVMADLMGFRRRCDFGCDCDPHRLGAY